VSCENDTCVCGDLFLLQTSLFHIIIHDVYNLNCGGGENRRQITLQALCGTNTSYWSVFHNQFQLVSANIICFNYSILTSIFLLALLSMSRLNCKIDGWIGG